MKQKWFTVLKDLRGNDIERDVMVNGKPAVPMQTEKVTLASVCEEALCSQLPDDQTASGVEKMRRVHLAEIIHDNREREADVPMTAAMLSDLKERINKFWIPMIVTKAWRMLDPDEMKVERKADAAGEK